MAWTWDDAAARWLDETRHKATHERDRSKLGVLDAWLRARRLETIKGDDVSKIGRWIADRTSPANANRYLALIRAILRRAHQVWEWTGRCPKIVMYPEKRRRVRWLTPSQVRRLLERLPDHQRDVVLFALVTGLRHGNIVGLQWSQVDMRRRLAWIHADQAKARRPISVPLSATAMDVLRRRRRDHETHVFVYRGRPVRCANTKAWRDALASLGIRDFRWHDLRHTWASWHVQNGTPLHVLQELGAWQSEAMVKRYAHLAPSHYARHAETISRVLSTTPRRPCRA